MTQIPNAVRRAFACASALVLTACATAPKTPLSHPAWVNGPDKVANVSVTATNVMRWYDIADALQSVQFSYDQDKLLSEATTTTSSVGAYNVDALSGTVAAALAGATISKTDTTGLDSSGNPTHSLTRTDQITPPSQPGSVTFNVAAPNANTTVPSGATSGTEAQLKLTAAAALAEEVAIINRRVASLPVRAGYRPYFLSLQISVHPHQHGLPYDSVFEIHFAAEGATGPNAGAATAAGAIYALPLLVTDAIEETSEAQQAQVIRQLGLQLAATGGMANASAGLQRTLAALEAEQDARPNSLMSLGRVDDSTIRVRLGANRFGSDYEMLPRTHNVSLVLLVPLDLVREHRASSGGRRADSRVATPLVQMTANVRYEDAMSRVRPPYHPAGSGYGEAAVAYDPTDPDGWAVSPAGQENIPLPIVYSPKCPPSQDVFIIPGKQGDLDVATVTLAGRTWLSGRSLEAWLSTPPLIGGKPMKLHATDTEVTDSYVRLVFPSFTTALPPAKKTPQLVRSNVSFLAPSVYDDGGEPSLDCTAFNYSAGYIVTPAKSDAAAQKDAKPEKPAAGSTAKPATSNLLMLKKLPDLALPAG
jgi:hypothetical protein